MPHSLQIKPLLVLLATIILAVLVSGCGEITRSEYDNARTYDNYVTEFQLPNGDTRVVWHGLNPSITTEGHYECPSGVRVADFRNGILVARWWQSDLAMPK